MMNAYRRIAERMRADEHGLAAKILQDELEILLGVAEAVRKELMEFPSSKSERAAVVQRCADSLRAALEKWQP